MPDSLRVDPVLRHIEAAVRSVRSSFDDIVQLDHLTGLKNVRGLDAAIEELLAEGDPFWAAFVEIDKFKNVNKTFGLSTANGLLMQVGSVLQRTGHDHFATSMAFRAHGDEFFVVGSGAFESIDVEECLNDLRIKVEQVAIPVVGHDSPMTCTVTVGWTVSEGAVSLEQLRNDLEAAVDAGKRLGRNTVVRFVPTLGGPRQVIDERADCYACQARFTVDIPAATDLGRALLCPNCGTECAR